MLARRVVVRVALVALVLLGVAAPADAQVIAPPPPVVTPPPVVGPTPYTPPDTSPGSSYLDSLCNGALGWMVRDLGYSCASDSSPPSGSTDTQPVPFDPGVPLDQIFGEGPYKEQLEGQHFGYWDGVLSTGTPRLIDSLDVAPVVGTSSAMLAAVVRVPASGTSILFQWQDHERTTQVFVNSSGQVGYQGFYKTNGSPNQSGSHSSGKSPGDLLQVTLTVTANGYGTLFVDGQSLGGGGERYFYARPTTGTGFYLGDHYGRHSAEVPTDVLFPALRQPDASGTTCLPCLVTAASGIDHEVVTTEPSGWDWSFSDFLDRFNDDLEDRLSAPPVVAPEPTPSTIPTGTSIPGTDLEPAPGETTDTSLGNRIGGFFGVLIDAMWDMFGWLGEHIRGLFGWLVATAWAVATWIVGQIAALIAEVMTVLNALLEAIIHFATAVAGYFTTVISWLQGLWALASGILTAVAQGFRDVLAYLARLVMEIPSLLWSAVNWLAELARLIASLPVLFMQMLWDLLHWLFVPPNPPSPPELAPPIIDVVLDIPPMVGDVIDLVSLGPSCGPSLNVSLPDTIAGDSGSLSWHAPNPAGSGCPGNGPDGVWTNADTQIGDLFGYRSAVRAALSILVGLGFAMAAYRNFAFWNKGGPVVYTIAGEAGGHPIYTDDSGEFVNRDQMGVW